MKTRSSVSETVLIEKQCFGTLILIKFSGFAFRQLKLIVLLVVEVLMKNNVEMHAF